MLSNFDARLEIVTREQSQPGKTCEESTSGNRKGSADIRL